ncbi:hypothetical protein SAMN02927923_02456 [Microvirga guangxiensis]|uniref:Uncharacterized protein n=1 Tax=Microvirga guangxiensis TaxID=549386 RepID=A0A1G5J2V5_9HYPH|nr:hypothetical protein SAMN02927923_02456 [Microvirga guangxiensis]
MRYFILLCVSLIPLTTFVAEPASAQQRLRPQGGFQGGGMGSVGIGPRMRPDAIGPVGVRPGGFTPNRPPRFVPSGNRWQVGPDRWRPGPDRWRPGWRPGRYYPNRYVRRGYWGWGGYYPGYYDDWGWGWGAAGLATGLAIEAVATPAYPLYAEPAPSPIGGYCATPVRTCALTNPAPIGIGCSCRVPGGRARGTVVGP